MRPATVAQLKISLPGDGLPPLPKGLPPLVAPTPGDSPFWQGLMDATSNAGRCVADCPNADADIKATRTVVLKATVTGGIFLAQGA
jgi:hypothetical protein